MYLGCLSVNHIFNARWAMDRHLGKIALEIVQMLWTAHWVLGGVGECGGLTPYKRTHENHPLARWVRACRGNYEFACERARALCREHRRRFKWPASRTMAVEPHLAWLEEHLSDSLPRCREVTPIPPPESTRIEGEDYTTTHDASVQAYRRLYATTKLAILRYHHSPIPPWLDVSLLQPNQLKSVVSSSRTKRNATIDTGVVVAQKRIKH